MYGAVQAVKCRGGQLLHGQQLRSGLLIHNVVIPHIQGILGLLQHISSVIQYLFLKYSAGFLHCHTADIGLPGSICAGIKGAYVRILGGQHIYLIFRDSGHLCRHLGKHGVGALADFRCPHLQLHGAVLVQYHAAGRCFQGYGIYACLIAEDSHTDSLSHGSCLVFIFPAFLIPADEFPALFHTFRQAVCIAFHMSVGVNVSRPHAVLFPEFQRVHVKGQGQVVCHAFRGKRCLGNSVSPHGAARGQIGVHSPGIGLQHLLILVNLLELIGGVGYDGMGMGRVSALVGICLQLPGNQRAVLPGRCLYLELDGMAHPGTSQSFFPGYLHPYPSSSHLGGKESI